MLLKVNLRKGLCILFPHQTEPMNHGSKVSEEIMFRKKRMLNGSERMCSGTRECNKCKCIEIISMYGARIEQIVTLIWPVRLEKQVLQSARNLNTDFPRIGNQS